MLLHWLSTKPFSWPKVAVALAAGVFTGLVAFMLTTGTASRLWLGESFVLLATLLSASCVMTLISQRDSRHISATHRLSLWSGSASRQSAPSAGAAGTPERRRRDYLYPERFGGSTRCYYCAQRIFHVDGEWYAPRGEDWITAFLCNGQQFKAPHSPVATDPLVRLLEEHGHD
jgi:hypothetical protein